MIIKALLMPVYLVILIIHLAVSLALKMSAWIFYLLGGLFLLTTICCYYMQLEIAVELRRMLICSGVMFMIPQIATMLSVFLEVAIEVLGASIHGKA